MSIPRARMKLWTNRDIVTGEHLSAAQHPAGHALGIRGYTLVELMIVVSIVGILATLAEPQYQGAVLRAREAALKQDLFTLRDAIDQYKADRGKYPPSLAELQSAGYIKHIPVDPFTKAASSWQTILDQPDGGLFDVHSGSELIGTDGIPYNQW